MDGINVENVEEPVEPIDNNPTDLEKILDDMPMSFESKEISESELSEADQLSVGEEMGTVDRHKLVVISNKLRTSKSPSNKSLSNIMSDSIKFKTIKSVLA